MADDITPNTAAQPASPAPAAPVPKPEVGTDVAAQQKPVGRAKTPSPPTADGTQVVTDHRVPDSPHEAAARADELAAAAAQQAEATWATGTPPVPITTSSHRRVTAREGEEIWEMTTPGSIYLETVNARGRPQTIRVNGQGSLLRIQTLDRELAQEKIRRELNDPFRNGKLVRIDSDQNADPETASRDALSPAALADVFAVSGADFTDVLGDFNELTLRRMKDMIDDRVVDATSSQIETLSEQLEARFPISSGETGVYAEMTARGEVAAANAGAGRMGTATR